ncbi:dicarboxylate transporter/tellurite-resistance protein TehA [Luteibacter aegosomatissinici]|uniref:dicarboxylate transporter/tellurite-resistance protein TehA n=1 Tax=Luteibacter aegosomatissinici TaxID=2911539 RepID=UPI001FFBE810|nr:dicarboxylate transporter/tellurite-resistance protein TehA [Luteibacter aegosomatissinici]UPG92530.1 dicarboxylate transporter/tellurite-resistance protein TehA [Luteibacter aegosomatissinici]
MVLRRSIPASFFGMVLGLVGLGSNWRNASHLWGLPPAIGEAIMAAAFVVWAVLITCYAMKWLGHREAAVEEARHPVQCCFIGLVPATTALMGVVLAPHSHMLAVLALVIGGVGHVLFSVWRVGDMLQGGREMTTVTPVIYLPSVAGNFITAITAGTLGFPSWGILFFGAGVFTWLALESVIVNRLFHAQELPVALRPTLGIQLAPPVVAVAAWLANTQGLPELLVQAAWGYGLLQFFLLVRLLPWIMKQPFAPSYWAFTFGLTALSGTAISMSSRGLTGAIADVAPVLFVITNVALAIIIIGTIVRAAQDKLLPPAAAPVVTAPATK